MAVGLFVRLHRIGSDGLWIDEAFSVWLARHPLSEMVRWISLVDHHPPLYYALLRGWTAVLGDGESSARALSASFGVLTIPLVYLLGRRIANRKAGLVGALLLALSPFHVRLGQEARMYPLLTLLACGALNAFVRLLDQRRGIGASGAVRPWEGAACTRAPDRARATWLPWVGYAVCTAAMLWTHNTAVFFPLAANVVVLGHGLIRSQVADQSSANEVFTPSLKGSRRSWLGRWLGTQVVIVLLWLPWIPTLLSQASDVFGRFWLPAPTPLTIPGVVSAFLCDASAWSLATCLVVDAVLAGLALLGLREINRRPNYSVLLGLMFVTPFVGQWLVSLWRPILCARTLVWASIPLYLMLAVGIGRAGSCAIPKMSSGGCMLAAVVAMVGINGAALGTYYADVEKESWDEAAALVAEQIQPGDVVLFNDAWGQIPFDYYFGELYNRQPMPDVIEHGLPVDLFDRGVLEPKMRERDVPRLRSLVAGRQRTWLVYSHEWYTDPEGLTPRTLAAALDLDQQWTFQGVSVRLYGGR
ncbi:MAG: glycosyltransferase family 39 protein [Anaerolineae bacterium]|jgi:hypothetical protein